MSGPNPSDDFTLGGYRSLVTSFLDAGYRVVGFGAVDPGSRHLVLRHDVDFSPDYCLPVARAEAGLGVSGIYYFLVSSSFYNVLDIGVKRVIAEIVGLGHQVGLHFDVSAYPDEPLEPHAEREAALLASVSGRPVPSISFHRPVESLIGRVEDFAGLPHSYQPRFIEDIRYISDSRGRWRFGHPLESQAFVDRSAIQLLTHPIWWHLETAEAPADRLRRCLADFATGAERDMRRNTTVFEDDQ